MEWKFVCKCILCKTAYQWFSQIFLPWVRWLTRNPRKLELITEILSKVTSPKHVSKRSFKFSDFHSLVIVVVFQKRATRLICSFVSLRHFICNIYHKYPIWVYLYYIYLHTIYTYIHIHTYIKLNRSFSAYVIM